MPTRATDQDGTYPRPQLVRPTWTDLGGAWQFAHDDARVGVAEGWQADADLAERGAFDRDITVPYPPETGNLHYEIELVVAIGGHGSDVPAARALDLVWGYGVGIDLTRRDLQLQAREQGRPWDWGKGFDLSAPCAPLRPVDRVGHPARGRIWLAVDGAVKQDADIAELIWSVPETVSIVSRSMALKPGDLIYTGTPAGVGKVERGETLTGGVEGVGEITLRVA